MFVVQQARQARQDDPRHVAKLGKQFGARATHIVFEIVTDCINMSISCKLLKLISMTRMANTTNSSLNYTWRTSIFQSVIQFVCWRAG